MFHNFWGAGNLEAQPCDRHPTVITKQQFSGVHHRHHQEKTQEFQKLRNAPSIIEQTPNEQLWIYVYIGNLLFYQNQDI